MDEGAPAFERLGHQRPLLGREELKAALLLGVKHQNAQGDRSEEARKPRPVGIRHLSLADDQWEEIVREGALEPTHRVLAAPTEPIHPPASCTRRFGVVPSRRKPVADDSFSQR